MRIKLNMASWIALAAIFLALVGFFAYQAFDWTVNRYYVPDGYSLLLRYKGPLIMTWTGKYAAPGCFAQPGEIGVLEDMPGPGRHFYCPIWWERNLIPDVVVKPGELAIVTSKLGADLPSGQFLVDGDIGEAKSKGILRRTFGPGRYRINAYGYKYDMVKTVQEDVGEGQIKQSGWVQIQPGYVGVATYLTDNPKATPQRSAGIQKDTLPPGLYAVNPREMQIDIISIGYNAEEISTEKKKDARGTILFDESGEEQPVADTGISFPSSDGFKIHMDFSAVWGILPSQAPEIIGRFGNLEAVRQKVIIPQCESICRNNGSKLGAVGLLIGKSRQEFQENVDKDFSKVLEEKNISLLYGLIRHIFIPKEVREPIQKGYVADELALTRAQETTTAKMEASLREAEQTVLLEAAKITEGTKKLIAETKATGQKESETIAAETEKKVATIDRQCAEIDAKKTVALGEAENNSKRMQQEAHAQLFELAVKAFGDPTAYTQWQFAQGLPENIDLKMIYSGPGTLWTDLKGLTPMLNVNPEKPGR
ncbi:MAG: band 7 protein [Pirellulales bacterium]|nr:band 7 protein [Pirellulales bacterium]